MASPFYVWDPRTHDGFPASLEQAEYSAIHAPRESDLSPAVESWIEAVKTFTLSDANKPYMSDHVIGDVKAMQPRTVLELEQMHIEGGEYFYKFLVESIQSYGLAAYDSYRGIFICSEYLLPPQASQQLAQQFAHVVHPAQDVIDIDRLPTSQKQFEALVYGWVEQQQFKAGRFELKEVETEGIGTWPCLVRENDLFIEICGLSLSYRGEPQVQRFNHKIKIKPLIGIARLDGITIFPGEVKFKQEKVCHYRRYLDNPALLKAFLQQFKSYFDLIDPHLTSLTHLNLLLNHNDDFNFKNDYFSYGKKPGRVPTLLALAKLCNDPAYSALYEQWAANVEVDKGKAVFKDEELENAFLSQLQPVENI